MSGASAAKKGPSPATLLLRKDLRELGLNYVEEFNFDPDRRWKADFHLVDYRILLEIEGGVWTRGRHTRGKGYEDDCLKYATATMQGWRVLRFTTQQVLKGVAREFLEKWIGKG